jgi:pilus assembly protein Flp/PilA
MTGVDSNGLRLLCEDETGATATEYAIMLVLIILVAFATIIFLGQKVDQAFNRFVTLFNP